MLKTADDIKKLRIGVDKGTTQETLLREKYPATPVVAYDDTPLAFTALRNGNVQAITQDDAKLLGLLANAPDKSKYEISSFCANAGIPRHWFATRRRAPDASGQ
ncbi:transporter substrate-binding domain-containing protein [Chitinibacter sp. FCG-7]|uniref:Transporter substrate-binding domain-containing protein n=1 Tax=Chitinibacter mangrovi TaxID=3153927 RepID=A0AAU7FBK9_9NEIS